MPFTAQSSIVFLVVLVNRGAAVHVPGFPSSKIAPILDIVKGRTDQIHQQLADLANKTQERVAQAKTSLKTAGAKAEARTRASTTQAPPAVQVAAQAPIVAKAKGVLNAKNVSLLPGLMKQEEAALRSSAQALGQYKTASANTQQLLADKDLAEKRQSDAAQAVGDAVSKLRDAKAKRVEAAQLDMQSDPLSKHTEQLHKKMANAEALVSAAEESMTAASVAARSADRKADTVEAKVQNALEQQAGYEEELKRAQDEAGQLAGVVSREEEKLETALATLRKQEESVNADMEKVMAQSAATMPTPSPKSAAQPSGTGKGTKVNKVSKAKPVTPAPVMPSKLHAGTSQVYERAAEVLHRAAALPAPSKLAAAVAQPTGLSSVDLGNLTRITVN